jgi:hypothetical protein
MKKSKTRVCIRIPAEIYKAVFADLRRPHPFAAERVGFLSASYKRYQKNEAIITITEYHTVPDDHYIRDSSVGAKINGDAIRACMQRIINTKKGCFHVHLHEHRSRPSPSPTDQNGLPPLVQSFFNVNPKFANGFLIFSKDSFYG